MKNKKYIIPDTYIINGYKGIMDLDLTSIDKKFHQELVSLHFKQIEDYKLEQLKRPINLRYENTIERLEKQNKEISKIIHKREIAILEEKNHHYQLRLKYWKAKQ
jgi:hypothetical protein